jgi:hypothetical protein
VVKLYTAKRRDTPAIHLLRSAAHSAEFALAQYLVKGIAAGDTDMIAEAEGMLSTLAADIAEYGGQPIRVEPLPPAQPDVPPPGQAPASPGLIDAPAATDVSEAMPAVHVTPIPVDVQPLPVEVTPIPADGMDSGADADQPTGQDPSPGALDDDAAEDTAENAGAPDDAEADGAEDGAQNRAEAQEDTPAAKPSGADTSTVALTVVDAKAT